MAIVLTKKAFKNSFKVGNGSVSRDILSIPVNGPDFKRTKVHTRHEKRIYTAYHYRY
ncbi:hypothetical protein FHS10_001059 [Mucilaginibacter dorajii]|nr:hypothetical protein [Mucilaginibacter dorajii]